MMKGIVKLLIFIIISASIFSESKILVIESYNAKYDWDKKYIKALKETIYPGNSLYFFEMDTKNLPDSEHKKMADKAFEEFIRINPDIVILGDDAALKYLGPRLVGWDIPVIYLGINNNPRNYFSKLPYNIGGVLERPLFKRSLVFVKEFIPNAEKVLILFDTDITAKIVKNEYFYNRNSIRIEGMDIDLVLIDDFETWKSIIRNSREEYDFIILGLYQTIRDKNGEVVDMDVVAKWTSENTSLPLFSFWDFSVGKDRAIGGYVLSAREMGERAGVLVNRLLDGEKIENIGQIYDDKGIFLFSKKQLEKWNFKLSDRILDEVEYTD